jgi:hypothetical protein
MLTGSEVKSLRSGKATILILRSVFAAIIVCLWPAIIPIFAGARR